MLLVTSCASVLDGPVQDIEVITPGAQDSVCYLYVDGVRHRVYPPETIKILRSQEDLRVDCLAPSNRKKSVIIEPTLSNKIEYNALNLGVGAVWDWATQAAFAYPARIDVDFTNVKPSAMPLPSYNNPDVKQPEEYYLEEFLPGQPRLNSDRDEIETTILRRKPFEPYMTEMPEDEAAPQEDTGEAIKQAIKPLAQDIDPSGETSKAPAKETENTQSSDSKAPEAPVSVAPAETAPPAPAASAPTPETSTSDSEGASMSSPPSGEEVNDITPHAGDSVPLINGK